MRSVQLAKVAAQAELLRLRRFSRRQAVRAGFGVVAVVFLLACLAALHVAGFVALLRVVAPLYSALIVAAVDLVIGVVLGLLAMRNTPDRVEREALQVRETAQHQMMQAAAVTALIGPLLRLIGTRKVYGVALAALTARYLGGARR